MAKRPPSSALRNFLRSEAAGGILLMIAAALAMVVANLSATHDLYHAFTHYETGPVLTPKLGVMTTHLWINDGLMAIFFLLVGLEIKREIMDGQLARPEDRILPVVAAIAGMAMPAVIYLAVTGSVDGLSRGWAIPAATDIAFAIGVMALLGKRAPTSLKLFLTTVAIVDDMGAVAIIAAVYTEALSWVPFFAGVAILAGMFVMNRLGVRAVWPYVLGFLALWYAELLSGIHATVAGVLTAMAVPIKVTPAAPDAEDSTLHRMEHALTPWVAYLIVPIFGFANAGVELGGGASVFAPLPLGIAAGLFIGKQLGVFGAVWATVKLGFADKPAHASWGQIYGAALLCGIGFTMSLFIGGLAFPGNAELIDEAKIGVLLGSVLSALVGAAVLGFSPPERREKTPVRVE